MASSNDDPSLGDVLAKKYEITAFLGHGGMGSVYSALDRTSGGRVAIKLPRHEVRSRKKALARFRQESVAAARLRGPHVVRVTDVAELDDGTPFIVMELLVGRDLASEIDAHGALPIREAVDYVLQAASGVAEAHTAGIVHRDLKPHNLFLIDEAEGRRVKVLDFGISKIEGGEIAHMTTTNARLGTPLYVSPEQLVSAKYVDARSDVWSLGVILYETLTGVVPFEGQTAIAVAAAIQTLEPPPPSARTPGVPPELDRVVMKALAKKAAERFQSVSELARALAPFAAPGAYAAPEARVPRRAPAPEALRGGTHADSPREDVVAESAGATPGSEVFRRVDTSTGASSAPSRFLLVLAALFGIALLALALAYR